MGIAFPRFICPARPRRRTDEDPVVQSIQLLDRVDDELTAVLLRHAGCGKGALRAAARQGRCEAGAMANRPSSILSGPWNAGFAARTG